MALAIVADFSFFINSAMQKCMDHDTLTMKGNIYVSFYCICR